MRRLVGPACVAAIVFAASPARAEEKDKEKEKERGKPAAKAAAAQAQHEAATPSVDYSHELIGHVSYKSSEGRLKGEGPEGGKDTQMSSTTLTASLMYGYLLGDHSEPVVEVAYGKTKEKVAEFSGTGKTLEWSVGVLFNIPTVSRDEVPPEPSRNTPLFSRSTWIPYGGILLSSLSADGEDGAGEAAKTSEGDVITKLVFGLRIVPFERVGIHTSVRVSHQKSSNTAETTDKMGGSTSKTTVEARLFDLTLLL